MNVIAASTQLGMSPQSVRKAIARGRLAADLVLGPHGEQYDISPTEVERYRVESRKPRRASR